MWEGEGGRKKGTRGSFIGAECVSWCCVVNEAEVMVGHVGRQSRQSRGSF